MHHWTITQGVFCPGAYIPWKSRMPYMGIRDRILALRTQRSSNTTYLKHPQVAVHTRSTKPHLKNIQTKIHTFCHQDQYSTHRTLPGSVKDVILWILYLCSTWLPPRILSTFEVARGFMVLCWRYVRSYTKFQFYPYDSKINETQTPYLSHLIIFLWKI